MARLMDLLLGLAKWPPSIRRASTASICLCFIIDQFHPFDQSFFTKKTKYLLFFVNRLSIQ